MSLPRLLKYIFDGCLLLLCLLCLLYINQDFADFEITLLERTKQYIKKANDSIVQTKTVPKSNVKDRYIVEPRRFATSDLLKEKVFAYWGAFGPCVRSIEICGNNLFMSSGFDQGTPISDG